MGQVLESARHPVSLITDLDGFGRCFGHAYRDVSHKVPRVGQRDMSGNIFSRKTRQDRFFSSLGWFAPRQRKWAQMSARRVFWNIAVTDRRYGATDVRRNGASNRWVKRHPEGVKQRWILPLFGRRFSG